MRYKTVKTSMGHKFKVEMSAQEIRERRLMGFALTVVPFLASMALFGIWVSGV
jgi:hypothetical protein